MRLGDGLLAEFKIGRYILLGEIVRLVQLVYHTRQDMYV